MPFKFPETPWLDLDHVQKEWAITLDEILKHAARGLLRLHAFAKPLGSQAHFHKLAENGGWKYTSWSPTNPICLTEAHVAELLHTPYIVLTEWETKDGTTWRSGLGNTDPGLQVFIMDLVIFQEEKKLFEDRYKVDESKEKIIDVSEEQIRATERTLLKQIACLAMLLADTSNRLRKTDKTPNGNQIAEALEAMLADFPDLNKHGVKNSSIRQSIKEGLALLNK
jgi:hypothetical protein